MLRAAVPTFTRGEEISGPFVSNAMRRFLFHLHSWMGLAAGAALLVIALTGSALVFRREIESVVMPQRVLATHPVEVRLGLDELVIRLREQLIGYEPVGWLPAQSRSRNDQVSVAGEDGRPPEVIWIDAATGKIHGQPTDSNKTITGWLLELHYSLLGGHIVTFLAGILATLLCLLGISGVWIYRGFWKNLVRLRFNCSARIFFSDLHKTVGISSVAFNLILGFTGAYWNLTHVIGHLVHGPDPEPPKVTGPRFSETLSLDGLLKEARSRIPDFEWTYLSFPTKLDEPLVFYGKLANQHALRGEYGSTVTFNSQTGAFEDLLDIRTSGLWNQISDAFMPLHYGTFGALPVKILWSIGGLAPGILAVTGFLLWWKRKRPALKHRFRFATIASEQINR